MFEETNQAAEHENTQGITQETTDEMPASLFEDESAAVETTPAKENEPEQRENAEGETAAAESTAEPAPQKVTVKYNGEAKEISLEEAVQLAQKGMNYDHVKQELDGFREKQKSEDDILESYAKMSGMTRDAYVAMLGEKAKGFAAEKALSEVQKKFPDADEDVLAELAAQRARVEELERRERENEERRNEMDRRTKPWRDLMSAYPNLDISNLPESVMHDIEGGMEPLQAYQKQLISELKQKLSVAEQTDYNRAHAMGSAKPDAAEEKKDPFLAGFFG